MKKALSQDRAFSGGSADVCFTAAFVFSQMPRAKAASQQCHSLQEAADKAPRWLETNPKG